VPKLWNTLGSQGYWFLQPTSLHRSSLCFVFDDWRYGGSCGMNYTPRVTAKAILSFLACCGVIGYEVVAVI
jgi:hypothetical protein